jgi:hypothetical protein
LLRRVSRTTRQTNVDKDIYAAAEDGESGGITERTCIRTYRDAGRSIAVGKSETLKDVGGCRGSGEVRDVGKSRGKAS